MLTMDRPSGDHDTLKTVLIRCPKTGLPLSTGTATGTTPNLNLLLPGKVKCPHCGETHSWSVKDVFLE